MGHLLARSLAGLGIVVLLVATTMVPAHASYLALDPPQVSNSVTQSTELTLDGTLDIVYGDARDGKSGHVLYVLSLANGTRLQLVFATDPPPFTYFQKPVAVTGSVKEYVIVKAGETEARPYILVSKIELSQVGSLIAASVTGTRKVIMLLLKFSDDVDVPHQPSFYSDLINPATPLPGFLSPATVNGFYGNSSWSQFSWLADVGGDGGVPATAWLTLPHPKIYYAPCGWDQMCADLTAITNDGTAAGVAEGIYFPQYDNINFVLSNDLDCCAWGGGFTGTLNGVYKSYGATWEPPWGQEVATYSHEMGHSLGLPHSGWVYYAYDSPWDIMSTVMWAGQAQTCGTYYSRNNNQQSTLYCPRPGDDISGPYKDYLGWIDSNHEATIPAGSSTSVTLDGLALPLGSPLKMIKICTAGYPCAGDDAHYFTVEARVGSAYGDGGLSGEGVIIHMFEADRPPVSGSCFWNSQSGPAWPIDSTPGDWDSGDCDAGGREYPNYALFNAQWSPGQTYASVTYDLRINVISRQGSTFVIAINPISQFGPTALTMLDAPARAVYFIFPDGNRAHPKPPGVGYASVTDWTALGYVYGSLANMPQITALDTNSTYIDQATGAPKIHDSIIVLFGGTLVNALVHYYEENRIAPLWWSLEGSWSSGTLYYRTRSGEVGASMPIQTVGGGSADMMLVEAFMDANGNTVLIYSGFGWQGTFTSGFYFKTVLCQGDNVAGLTDSWYFYSWTDMNGNGFVEDYEVNPTPINHGN